MAWLKNAIAKWRAKPHQSEKEKQRRRRQMLNGTHGYEKQTIRGKYNA